MLLLVPHVLREHVLLLQQRLVVREVLRVAAHDRRPRVRVQRGVPHHLQCSTLQDFRAQRDAYPCLSFLEDVILPLQRFPRYRQGA